jgi:hypothetical protein
MNIMFWHNAGKFWEEKMNHGLSHACDLCMREKNVNFSLWKIKKSGDIDV